MSRGTKGVERDIPPPVQTKIKLIIECSNMHSLNQNNLIRGGGGAGQWVGGKAKWESPQ